jgi:multiple sugar transport system ATP-binding protein
MLGIRAENIEVRKEPAEALIRASVVVLEPLGSHNLLTVKTGNDVLKVAARADLFPPRDSDVWLRIDPERIRWMDRQSREAIAS